MIRAFTLGTFIMLALIIGGCSGGGGTTPPPGSDGGISGTTTDLAMIRSKRDLPPLDEPAGLRNLEVLIGGARTPVTAAATIETSVCQIRCALTPDRSRLLYVTRTPDLALMSAPVSGLVPNLGQAVQLNEQGKPLAQTAALLIPPGNRVLFLQEETQAMATDGGTQGPTFTLASAPVAGGALIKYRNGPFLPNSPFTVSPDGAKIILGETLGAASQINLFLYDASGGGERQLFRFTQEGSAEFGGEVMACSPDGREVVMATQSMGNKVLTKVASDGTTTTPTQLRIGPVECGAAAANEICLVQSPLFYTANGQTILFLGGRQVGIDIVSQLYAVNANLQSPPQALTSFTTEVQSLSINKARTRVVWATQAGPLKRNNAIFGQDLSGASLTGQPVLVFDDPASLGSHFQEAVFLE